jgi:hypothetical protein
MNRVPLSRGAGAGEPVHVWLRPDGDVPEEFVWRGQRHRVRAVEPDGSSGASRRKGLRRLRVRTSSGLRCILVHDPGFGSWRMDRLIAAGGVR